MVGPCYLAGKGVLDELWASGLAGVPVFRYMRLIRLTEGFCDAVKNK